jgi:hypothetical protein
MMNIPRAYAQTLIDAAHKGRANEKLRCGDQAEQRACAAAERGEQAAIFASTAPLHRVQGPSGWQPSFCMDENRAREEFAILIFVEPGALDIEQAKAG